MYIVMNYQIFSEYVLKTIIQVIVSARNVSIDLPEHLWMGAHHTPNLSFHLSQVK